MFQECVIGLCRMILRYEEKEDTKVLFGVRYMEAPGDADTSISRFASQSVSK